MPIYLKEIEQCLQQCDEALNRLIAHKDYAARVKKVCEYYNRAYHQALATACPEKIERLVNNYKHFIAQLESVKNNGDLNNALMEIKKNHPFNTQLHTLFHNLAKVCQALFWAATALTLLGAIHAIAIPLFLTQPVAGIIAGIALVGLVITTAAKAISCLRETDFVSEFRHHHHKKALLSFFKQPDEKQKSDVDALTSENDAARPISLAS